MTTSLVKVFNNHLLEFIDDVLRIFPDNIDLKTGKTFIEGIKKINPKSLIKIWKISVVDLYKKQINNNDYTFFLNKDYKNDLPTDSTNKTMQIINDIKNLLKETSIKNKKKSMKYVQNLTKICILFFQNE
tara:strand:- start:1304 stop:1693 length:390 start_codon:yes stop_codon:yes gene_type:complete